MPRLMCIFNERAEGACHESFCFTRSAAFFSSSAVFSCNVRIRSAAPTTAPRVMVDMSQDFLVFLSVLISMILSYPKCVLNEPRG